MIATREQNIQTSSLPEIEDSWPESTSLKKTSASTFFSEIRPSSFTESNDCSYAISQQDKITSPTLLAPFELKEEKLNLLLLKLWSDARETIFEDGMESVFSKTLLRILSLYKTQAVRRVGYFLADESVNPEIAAEALRTLARNTDRFTYRERFHIIVSSLKHVSSTVREGAILALEISNDKRAIPILQNAIENESSLFLKNEIRQVICSLES